MNSNEFKKNGIINQFAAVFQTQDRADNLLDLIDFPDLMRPPFPDNNRTLGYWREIGNQIQAGVLSTGTDLQPLVDAAATFFPSNPIFSQYCSDHNQPTEENPNNTEQATTSTSQAQPVSNDNLFTILIQGRNDATNILASAQVVAPAQSISPDNITLRFSGNGIVLLGLNHCSSDAVASFSEGLRTILRSNQNSVTVSVLTEDPQPYLINRIFVEGADQSRFAIEDVSSDTRVGEVAQAVITEYTPGMSQDKTGKKRGVVVDKINEDGSTERLKGDDTLHEANIQEDDTLSVSPEATAGSVHPQIRQEALARAKNQIIAYAKAHRGFQVSANSHTTPTEYILNFQVPSFAPPIAPGEPPQPIDNHEVFLVLPGAFPMKAPQAFWQTPIFHPNIDLKTGLVCLGDLGDRYRPGLDFGKLCQLLIDIASYQNYAVQEGYNEEAQIWALSSEGQIAIEMRGGNSVLRQLIHQVQNPPKLNIKRLTDEQ
ncbi:MAG: ubiquitin-conjugating enzyme E2 [Xenococcaceae cyanobacterium]